MHKIKPLLSISLFCVVTMIISGCYLPLQFSTYPNRGQGLARINIPVTPNSPFQLIARNAACKISAPDMETIVKDLAVTSTSVQGEITQIPSGTNRFFEVSVYDSMNVVRYYGSNYADIIADSTAHVSIILYRTGGDAIINGSISEQPAPSNPTPPDITSGLVAWYPFNGNAADESDHGFNGTVNGAAATLTTDRFGKPDGRYFVNGQYNVVPDCIHRSGLV